MKTLFCASRMKFLICLVVFLSFNFAYSQTAQKVYGFELVNSDTNQRIGSLINGQTLNLTQLPKNFSIRAKTYPSIVGSVKFILDGGAFRTESAAPYTLTGDNSANYPIPWSPTIKSYTLSAAPYSGSSGSGTKGTALSIGFKVVTLTVSSFPINNIPADVFEKGYIRKPKDLATKSSEGVDLFVPTASTPAEEKNNFLAKVAAARPGDVVLLKGGDKWNWGETNITASGDPGKPIIIKSSGSPVVFKGNFHLKVSGSYIHLQGLSLVGTTGKHGVSFYGEGNRASLMHFKDVAGYSWATWENSKKNRVDHSLAEGSKYKTFYLDKRSFGARVDHNYLRSTYLNVVNGGEAIQVGTGALGEVSSTKYYTNALIDHNILQRMEGEGEMMGIKSDGNKIVFNVFVDSDKGHISFRAGHYNLVFGNVFRNTKGGTRIFGTEQKFIHNLIVNPIDYNAIRLPVGSDKSYLYNSANGTRNVRYIASRRASVNHNSVVFTASFKNSSKGVSEEIPQTDDGQICSGNPDEFIYCTLKPYNNSFLNNVFINQRLISTTTFGMTTGFADKNRNFQRNQTYGSSYAKFTVPTIISGGFTRSTSTAMSPHEKLAQHVLTPPVFSLANTTNSCLEMTRTKIAAFDVAHGVSFTTGSCKESHLDNSSYWERLNLMDANDVQMSEAAVYSWIKTNLPTMTLPVIPAFMPHP